jgi:hypothetical protein
MHTVEWVTSRPNNFAIILTVVAKIEFRERDLVQSITNAAFMFCFWLEKMSENVSWFSHPRTEMRHPMIRSAILDDPKSNSSAHTHTHPSIFETLSASTVWPAFAICELKPRWVLWVINAGSVSSHAVLAHKPGTASGTKIHQIHSNDEN